MQTKKVAAEATFNRNRLQKARGAFQRLRNVEERYIFRILSPSPLLILYFSFL